jgi:hypothetical protein
VAEGAYEGVRERATAAAGLLRLGTGRRWRHSGLTAVAAYLAAGREGESESAREREIQRCGLSG